MDILSENIITDELRAKVIDHAKRFKTSWVDLGQVLYPVWRDKYFKAWGYERFEHYAEKEIGLKKPLAIKLLKTYYFIEQEEPAYLKEEFTEKHDPPQVPTYDAINVLRLAKGKKELLKEDYLQLKKSIFDKGKDASAVRKELTALIKERKEVDPDEEREKRNEAAIRRLINSLRSFKKDMETLKLAPAELINETTEWILKLESQLK